MFSERWLSVAGGMIGERFSDGSVLERISLFFGGRHSLLRSWLDFMLISPHAPQLYLRYPSSSFGLQLSFFPLVLLPRSFTFVVAFVRFLTF